MNRSGDAILLSRFARVVFFTGAGMSAESGARTIEVNVDDTEATPLFDLKLRGPAGAVLPALFPIEVAA